MPSSYDIEVRGAFLCCLFTLRLVNADACCRRVQFNVPPLAPQKALRWQGQALAGSVPGSDVSTLGIAGSVPPTSVAIGGNEVPDAPTSPPPNPTLSARMMLLEAEVEKSVQMGMAVLEQLPRFGPDPALEGALPQGSEAPLPLTTEASGSTVGASASAGAQEAAKEAMLEGPSA
jgi:hypothetical protein